MSKLLSLIFVIAIGFILSACQECVVNDNIDGSPGELVGTLDGYEFYRESVTCDAFIGPIKIDGYNFGIFSSACGSTLDDIGYNIEKNNQDYNLQELVDEGTLRTKDIYYGIYKCDQYKKGE